MTIYRDQLEAVYRLIERPEAWTTIYHARNAHENVVDPKNDKAVCWCIDGAFIKCGLEYSKSESVLGVASTPEFNDSHTHAEVLALIKSAIERAPVRP